MYTFKLLNQTKFCIKNSKRVIQLIHTKNIKNMSEDHKPIENSIRQKITNALKTTHLEIINESYMHNVPKNAETHFKVVIVSDNFSNVPLIKRHRLVNDLLKEELNGGVHALSIVAKTPEQWQNNQTIESSPNCRGGFGK
ncbi:bolA-like protein DDB_G0274169 [Chrysoperla carnea]|uniref:bolA-like protein DDB_G0274169 n=1 Tax=Chrysoperla carnea TaxID=189513 RepID=UPI001D06273C|nr:bolA-like protein DDB_G0274169 [Chrysoperla carnea]